MLGARGLKSAACRVAARAGARPGSADLPVWLLTGSKLVPAIREACDAAAQAEREEYRRLLYVAMTRARDRLYVAGFEGQRQRDKDCWYNLIADGLDAHLVEAQDSFGNPVRRMECRQEVAPKSSADMTVEDTAAPMPDWHSAIAAQPRSPIVINPSRLDIAGDHGPALSPIAARAIWRSCAAV
ncbi:MAG: ATP-binding domain-containing protein [Rhodomicrobium sp.]|nr:ATP-binding domain-containing protein [Rhodomicrobium sp.]